MKILYKYQEIKAEIENLKDNIKFYQGLLQQEDLSELDYYKKIQYTGIKFFSINFSVVEREVLIKEKAHELNRNIIKELLQKESTKLLERENQINNIENALHVLSKEDSYIVKCKFFYKMKYKDICKNFAEVFKFYLSEQTIKQRVKKSTDKMSKIINRVYFIDLESTI